MSHIVIFFIKGSSCEKKGYEKGYLAQYFKLSAFFPLNFWTSEFFFHSLWRKTRSRKPKKKYFLFHIPKSFCVFFSSRSQFPFYICRIYWLKSKNLKRNVHMMHDKSHQLWLGITHFLRLLFKFISVYKSVFIVDCCGGMKLIVLSLSGRLVSDWLYFY